MPIARGLLLVLLLPALAGGCKAKGIDGLWQCRSESKEKLDLHKVQIPYTVAHMSRVKIEGDRFELGEGRPVVMKLVRKATDGPRHYVEATVSAGLPITPKPAAFVLELHDDGQALTIRELKDVDWTNPGRATGIHPVECVRR